MNPARSRQMLADDRDDQLRPQRVLSRPSDHWNSFGQHQRVHTRDDVTTMDFSCGSRVPQALLGRPHPRENLPHNLCLFSQGLTSALTSTVADEDIAAPERSVGHHIHSVARSDQLENSYEDIRKFQESESSLSILTLR
jgi:hypothetical protein